MYQVEAKYLEHDGGTKFYETVRIVGDGGKSILIKRYGPIGKRLGGGQTKIEYYASEGAAKSAQREILNQKSAPRPGKGVYKFAEAKFGFHIVGPKSLSQTGLRETTMKHYNETTDREAVSEYFDYFAMTPGVPAVDIVDTTKIEEPPIVRDGNWGSW